MKSSPGRKINWRKITGIVLAISLGLSIVYSAIMMALSPASLEVAAPGQHVRGYYLVTIGKCVLALLVAFIPSIINKKWSIELPNYMVAIYFVFLYASVYLGEVRSFYEKIPFWDTILHTFSGVMLGALGFSLVHLLNEAQHIKIQLSPLFVAIFAFCFALAAGAIWEIYEFTIDHIIDINMQTYLMPDGTPYVGHAALLDTMIDLIVDALGALVIALIGYLGLKRRSRRTKR